MRSWQILFVVILGSLFSWAGQAETPSTPQTARQALLEMFFSKTPGTFVKHLPAATLAAFQKSGTTTGLSQYAALTGQLGSQQKNIQTFEAGSVLLSAEDPKTSTKVEIIVENDALRGDNDDIELSFQTYKNGVVQRAPFMPRITFAMKMESGIWKLNEIGLAMRLPLADPDLLKTITEKMQDTHTISSPAAETTFPATNGDTNVITAMRTILTAETTYSTTYRSVGYTCTLSDLDGFGSSERNEHQAMLINSGLAGGRRFGYVFSLSQCAGTPASSFVLTAVPSGRSFGRRAYCTDQTGTIRYSADGNAANCVANGTPLQ